MQAVFPIETQGHCCFTLEELTRGEKVVSLASEHGM